MLETRTEGFQGYAVKYSPFLNDRIAVAASSNFGLVGNGRLLVYELAPSGLQLRRW
jgi:peroxin-7